MPDEPKYKTVASIEQIFRMLRYGELWFSSAKSFNDPFDTALTYNFDGLHTGLAERWMDSAAEQHTPELSVEERAKFKVNRLHQIRTDPNEIENMRQGSIDKNYDSFGICSLSSSKDDILMWGHYSGGHSGICIGLDVLHIWDLSNRFAKTEELIDLVKVQYSPSQPQINFFQAMLGSDFSHVMQFISTKFVNWSYENEFRLINWDHPDKPIIFGPEIILEVVFGLKVPIETKNAIVLFCRQHNPRVKFFQATKDLDDFKLNMIAL